jgi:hypothetical protein
LTADSDQMKPTDRMRNGERRLCDLRQQLPQ